MTVSGCWRYMMTLWPARYIYILYMHTETHTHTHAHIYERATRLFLIFQDLDWRDLSLHKSK